MTGLRSWHWTWPFLRAVLSSLCHPSYIVMQTNWQKFKASWDTDGCLSLQFSLWGKKRKEKRERIKGKREKEKLRHCFRTGELHRRTIVFWKICFGKMAVPLCLSAFLLNGTFFLSYLYLKYCRATWNIIFPLHPLRLSRQPHLKKEEEWESLFQKQHSLEVFLGESASIIFEHQSDNEVKSDVHFFFNLKS